MQLRQPIHLQPEWLPTPRGGRRLSPGTKTRHDTHRNFRARSRLKSVVAMRVDARQLRHQRRVIMLSLTRAAVKEIEDRGFRVRGYHDAINEGPAPLVMTATDTSTGKIYKFGVRTATNTKP